LTAGGPAPLSQPGQAETKIEADLAAGGLIHSQSSYLIRLNREIALFLPALIADR
jgi:hypothetical protein